MKILCRSPTEAEIAFGKRLSPAAVLRMTLRTHQVRPERTGFSPGASASAGVSRQMRVRAHGFLATRTGLLLRAPEKCKESVFEPPILLQNQANPQILLQF